MLAVISVFGATILLFFILKSYIFRPITYIHYSTRLMSEMNKRLINRLKLNRHWTIRLIDFQFFLSIGLNTNRLIVSRLIH